VSQNERHFLCFVWLEWRAVLKLVDQFFLYANEFLLENFEELLVVFSVDSIPFLLVFVYQGFVSFELIRIEHLNDRHYGKVDVVDILLLFRLSHLSEVNVDKTVQKPLVIDQNIVARLILNQRKHLLTLKGILLTRLNQLADGWIGGVLLRNEIHLNCQS